MASTFAHAEIAAAGGQGERPGLARAVEAGQIVRALRRYGFVQKEIGAAVGASDRSVRAWAAAPVISREHYQRLAELRRVVLMLEDDLSPIGVAQWFRSPNRLLGDHRPLEVFAEGSSAVYDAALAFHEGAYV